MSDSRKDKRTSLVAVRDLVSIGEDDRPLRRDFHQGLRRRLRRGIYVDEMRWAALTSLEKYQARIVAAVRTRRHPPVVAYESAAALWGYPRVGPWPSVVHLIVEATSGVQSKNGVVAHRDVLNPADVVEHDGLLVTTPLRTLVDLARSTPLGVSVPALDHALRTDADRVTADLLYTAREGLASMRGSRMAKRAIDFANSDAENAGESLSRVAIFELGFPDPVLQSRHVNPRGGSYYTDFEWPDFSAVGEFDGAGKYLKDEYLGRLTPGEAVYTEKVREDHLRAEGNAFARWSLPDILQPSQLRAILLRAGLPIVR